jgi:hypothetical protein
MGKIAKLQANDREVVYRMKEILCDFSEEVRQKILVTTDEVSLAHLKSVYELIPQAQYVIGYSLGSREREHG